MLMGDLNCLWQKGCMPQTILLTGHNKQLLYQIITEFASNILKANVATDMLIINSPEHGSISANQVRELNRWSNETSFSGNYKFAVINDAEKLSFSAVNACLKTLEEPAKHVFFILITDNASSLPKTLLSRCRILSQRHGIKHDSYEKLVNALINKDKSAIADVIEQSGAEVEMLLANWHKNFLIPTKLSVAERSLFKLASMRDILARSDVIRQVMENRLTLDSKHVASLLLNQFDD